MTTVEEIIRKNEAETVICDLRDLLTFVISNQHRIEQEHPETIEFNQWEDLHSDLRAMAERLSSYERLIENK